MTRKSTDTHHLDADGIPLEIGDSVVGTYLGVPGATGRVAVSTAAVSW